MTCDDCRVLLGKYLDGSLPPVEFSSMRVHVEQCAACQCEYDQINLTQTLLRATFEPRTSASNAARLILDELANRSAQVNRRPGLFASWSLRRGLPVAAAIAISLTAGLFLGSAWSRTHGIARLEQSDGPAVPILVAGLKGTVLVKHSSREAWSELTPSSALHVGDVFQASPKSELTLSFKDGSMVVLSANSRLWLEHYNGGIRLSLSTGGMRASLNSPHPPFIVSTPSGQLEALGTEFTVSVE